MKFKELLTKIVSGIVSEEEKNIFWDCVDNDDDLAELLCEAQIPRIMALMCENEFIKKKPYFKKYSLVSSLYESNMDISSITFDLEQLKAEIAPFLTPGHINLLVQQFQLREDAIETIMATKDEVRAEIAALEEKIKSHSPRGKKEGTAEKTATTKKKAPSKLEEQIETLKKKHAGLQDQERLLVSTYKRPEQILLYLKSLRETQLQSIKNREGILLENKSGKLSFEIGKEQSPADDELIQRLIAEIEKLKREKESIKSGLDKIIAEKIDLIAQRNARISELDKTCGNLRKDKERLEQEVAGLTTRLSQLEPKLRRAEAQIQEFDQILLTLNGRMYEMLAHPILELEKLYFNLNDYTEPMDPKVLASYFAEPIGKLRDGIENIRLNTSKVKILDRDYSISLLPCAEFDDWADRNPVDFDPEKHILMIGKAKQVYIITRGFSYTNNLGNTEVIKAEVRPADDESDMQGGTK